MASELRTRLINHMTLRRLAPKTQTAYVNAVAGLAKFHRTSPDRLDNDQIQSYLLHLIQDRQLAWSSLNVQFSAFRYFYKNVLSWPETAFHIPPRPRQRKLPEILSREETLRLIRSPDNPKHRALPMTVYSAGLRVGEAVNLRPRHIESGRMTIRVEEGKGRKDRYTVLSEALLAELKYYWRAFRPNDWLFFGKFRDRPMPVGTAQKIYCKAKKKCGIAKGRGIHTLRHCFATHLLENGTDIYRIKRLMGHASLSTTFGYTHVTEERISKVKSPLDELCESGALR